MKLKETEQISVEEVTRLLLQQKNTRQPFSLDITEKQAYDLLIGAYRAEVVRRGREFIVDANVMANLHAIAAALTAAKPRSGIMMCGVCGNGKTTALYAIQSAINICRNQGWINSDNGLMIVDAKELAVIAKNDERFAEIKRKPLLAVEDLGREPAEILDYGNIINPFIDLIEYRYDKMLFTAMTTNLVAEQIREKYGARIADRFNEMLNVIVFKQKTYRR